jgi:AAA+ ATPase superfamily predicted ATPase
MSKEKSPFTPGRPVPVDYFVGRINEVRHLERVIKQASTGRNENVFLTGERGIGKSSLADFICFLAQKDFAFVGAHCYLGAARNLEEICQLILRELVRQLPDRSLTNKVQTALSKYIEKIDFDLFGIGVGVELTRDAHKLEDIRLNFPDVIRSLYQTIGDEKKGIVLVLDDLDGVTTRVLEFAWFLKSFVDSLTEERRAFPLIILLVGIEVRMQDLALVQPSVPRIFERIELPLMTDRESSQFFTQAFESVNCKLEQEALDLLVYYSGGLPTLMHEVGDATFWLDEDNNIDLDDALEGVLQAADEVGRKYLTIKIYSAVRSSSYLSILRHIGGKLKKEFRRTEVLKEIPQAEKGKFDNFVGKMCSLGVIEHGRERGVYVFPNNLYRLYVYLEAKRAEEGKTKK